MDKGKILPYPDEKFYSGPPVPPPPPYTEHAQQQPHITNSTSSRQASPVVTGQPRVGVYPQQIFCQMCNKKVLSTTKTKTGSWTYIMCLILAFVGCDLGCCLIPFCIDSCKDVQHICPVCNRVVAIKEYKPLS